MKKLLNQFGPKPLINKENGSLVQQEHIKNRILILPELESLIPPLQTEEFSQLETNIKQEGCREPLLIWNTTQGVLDQTEEDTKVYVLVDGHNRFRICQRNGIDFKILLREFPDQEAVRDFMIDNQLGRRNLTQEQMAYFRGQKYLLSKKRQGRPLGDEERLSEAPIEEASIENKAASGKDHRRTDEKLAEQFKVSPKTIRLDADFARGADRMSDTLKKEILSGAAKVKKSDVIKLADRADLASPVETVEELQNLLTEDKPQSTSEKPEKNLVTRQSAQRALAKLQKLASGIELDSRDWSTVSEEILKLAQHLAAYQPGTFNKSSN